MLADICAPPGELLPTHACEGRRVAPAHRFQKFSGSESQSKVRTERDWRRRGPIGWTIETDWQDNFNEESLEEAVRDWPTVVRQGRKPPLRRIDVKRRSYPD